MFIKTRPKQNVFISHWKVVDKEAI